MNTKNSLRIVFMCSTLTTSCAMQAFSFKDMFASEAFEEVAHKKYTIEPGGTLNVDNTHGNIYVKSHWKSQDVHMKVVKKSSKQETMGNLDFNDHGSTPDNVAIKTTTNEKQRKKGSVDYLLIVPETVSLNLSTQKGDIVVKKTSGPVSATAVTGNIQVYSAQNTVHATTEKKGDITVDQAAGTILANTNRGNITVNQAQSTVRATSQKGHINVVYTQLPAVGSVDLQSDSGQITLTLPEQSSAYIKGKTSRGTITSQHLITMKPRTTKLDKQAWNLMKKEVEGTIGEGKALVTLNSTRGSIKIIESAVS